MEPKRVRVLIVDDDRDDAFLAQRLLERAVAIEAETAWESTYDAGLEAIRSHTHDVALVDYRLGERTGLDLLCAAGGAESPTPIILLTGQGDHEVDLRAMAAGAADYLIKGQVEPQSLERAIRYTLERRRVEDQLRESEARYRLLAETVTDVIAMHAPDGTYRYVSPASKSVLGYAPGDLLGESLYALIHEGDIAAVRQVHGRMLREDGVYTTSYRVKTEEGTYVWVETTGQAVHANSGTGVEEIITVTRDITARKRAEARIREQAALLDKANDAISACDLDGRIIYWNKSAERLTGWSSDEIQGRVADEVLGAVDDSRLAEAHRKVREVGEWSGELRQRTRSGEEIIVESRWTLVRDADGAPTSILIINTDVTEQKALETQFLRAQRMESIGRLVSGIAHDLGNLLVPVILGVKVMKQRYGDDERAARTLDMMQQSAQRGSDMVKQVLAFARGVEGERKPLQLSQVVAEVARITKETFPPNIEIETDIPDDLAMVQGDATQLQQVLMNLCVNARDAMEDGGRISIRARNTTVDERVARTNLEAKKGQYVHLSIADTGPGIPPEVIDKVFEPFFTTKDVGKGTGLGLSSVYSIVKSHGGFVNVNSTVGQGTVFHVYLPMADTEEGVPELPAMDDEAIEGHGERVLLVDDEAFIRISVREMLEEAGYKVVEASNGTVALDVYERAKQPPAVVVTDLAMPGMGGIELIGRLHSQDPSLPIIAASGMPDGNADRALAAGARRFIAKPFQAEQLLAALRQVLAHAASPAAS